MTRISRHATKRLAQRCGLNKKAMQRIVDKAFELGIPMQATKGDVNRWVLEVYSKNTNADNIRLYGDKAFLFDDTVLITVLQIPCNLIKKLQRQTVGA